MTEERSTVFRHRTRGDPHGPITRLISPSQLGRELKPFVFLDAVQVEVSRPFAFGWHPHSGIATVTIHFEGGSWAEESNQTRHTVPPGGVDWVRAGGGVWHRGGPSPGTERVSAFQLWLALGEEQELSPSVAEYFSPEQIPTTGSARVILGEYDNVRSPVPSSAGITYLQVELEAGQQVTFERNAGEVGFIAVLKGAVEVGSDRGRQSLESIELGILDPAAQRVVLEARSAVQLVCGSAPAHPYELAIGTYSVHTSPAALKKGEQGIARIFESIKELVESE